MNAQNTAAGTVLAPEVEDLRDLSSGAVDAFEVTARLEASGLSDRGAAGRLGIPDVFALGNLLHRTGKAPVAARRPSPPSGLAGSMRRAALLLAGALLAAAVLDTSRLAPRLVWVIGVSGWVGGQAVAAIAWTHLGRGTGREGLRRAGAAGLAVLALAALAPPLLAPHAGTVTAAAVICAVWAAHACAVSLLICSGRTKAALATVLAGLLVAGPLVLARWSWSAPVVLSVAAATSGVVVLLAVRLVLRAGRPLVPAGADWRAAAPAMSQAALLAASLLALVHTVPLAGAAPLIVASVVGAATADPVIVLLRARMRRSAGRVHRVAVAARHARRAAVTAAAATAVISTLAAVAVVLALQGSIGDWQPVVGPAAAFTSVATTSAALTAFGAPWRSVAAAGLVAGYAAAALLWGGLAVAVVFPIALVGAVGLLLRQVSDPRVLV